MGTLEYLEAARATLVSHRLQYSNEDALQASCLRALTSAQPEARWTRESLFIRSMAGPGPHQICLKKSRLDLYALAWGIGIECKTQGTFGQVLAQVAGYLTLEPVAGVLLVTTRHTLRGLPAELNGKPILTHWVAAQGL